MRNNPREVSCLAHDAVEKARAPLASLLSKSEKAQTKLSRDSWQWKMLDANIYTLRLVLSLVEEQAIK